MLKAETLPEVKKKSYIALSFEINLKSDTSHKFTASSKTGTRHGNNTQPYLSGKLEIQFWSY